MVGSRLVVKSGGTNVGTGDGTFEVVNLEGTAQGDVVPRPIRRSRACRRHLMAADLKRKE